MRPRPLSLLELVRRAIAAGSASVVLALAVFGASPALHEELHGADHSPTSDEGCAITLFAAGVSLSLVTLDPLAPLNVGEALVGRATAEVLLATPRYLHQPERGPPAVKFNV